jgi:hypothetical protein
MKSVMTINYMWTSDRGRTPIVTPALDMRPSVHEGLAEAGDYDHLTKNIHSQQELIGRGDDVK